MAGTYRPIPKGLGRFTYWNYASIRPVEPRLRSRHVSEETHQRWANLFKTHLIGKCGEQTCPIDAQLAKATPAERERIALEYLVETDARWNNVPGALKIFQTLDKKTRERLDRIWSRRRTEWAALLKKIARDQVAYERIVREKRSGRLGEVGAEFGQSEGWARQLYTRYARQASFLRGKGVRIGEPALRRWYKARGITLSGNYLPSQPLVPPSVAMGKSSKEKRAIEDRVIFHWLAHAFRNLVRYRDNHDPLPWQSGCADSCRRERDKWDREPRPASVGLRTPLRTV